MTGVHSLFNLGQCDSPSDSHCQTAVHVGRCAQGDFSTLPGGSHRQWRQKRSSIHHRSCQWYESNFITEKL